MVFLKIGQMNREIKIIIIGVGFFISAFSLMWGLIQGSVKSCQYESIISRVNIPYVIGCELTEPRFERKKE